MSIAANQAEPIKDNERLIYSHKFTMKEEAFQKMIDKGRTDTPKLISNEKQFKEAVDESLYANQVTVQVKNPYGSHTRNTKMGGHLSDTLNKAGAATIHTMDR